jgi:cytochrome c biogenesis protein CcdA
LLGALLGGLLLNIMPCVFPILSLKALSLAKAGGDEGAARREALAYTAGAVLICLALGAAARARAGGAAAGWAFQLQDPRVILFLLLLITAIALNLAGLFELPASGGGRLAGAAGGGAFWTGALAAFVATPCTGPFMGAALGRRPGASDGGALAVFAGLGLGLALPFLLLGFVPALRRRLPKPGAWMERFRRLLSVPMFLTALALAWILGRQAGVDGMALGLAAAMVLGLALWWVGRRQGRRGCMAAARARRACRRGRRLLLVPTAATEPAMASRPEALKSEPFSEARSPRFAPRGGRSSSISPPTGASPARSTRKARWSARRSPRPFAAKQRRRAGRRLDPRRRRDRPLPRKARPLGRAALPLLRAGQGRDPAAGAHALGLVSMVNC